MTRALRQAGDKLFTMTAGTSVFFMLATLIIVLGPMFYKGMGAVCFTETVEFRKMQRDLHGRYGGAQLDADTAAADAARAPVYEILDRFSRGIDTEANEDRTRHTYREFKKQMRNRKEDGDISEETYESIVAESKTIRDILLDALEAENADEAKGYLAQVLRHKTAPHWSQTAGESFFEIAQEYLHIVATVDLARREQYAQALGEVKEALTLLFGPRTQADKVGLAQFDYGMTRVDMAERELDKIFFDEQWVASKAGAALQQVKVSRKKQFAGTEMIKLLELLEDDVDKMMLPQKRIYWQYLFDDSTPGYYFGGIGPEALGTLLLTLLSMLAALPLGVGAAAYLAGCRKNGPLIRVIRTCISTLAGVPSIVFGLFGMAFFLLTVQPALGLGNGSSILAGGLTLAVLILPVIIRASEEAIRSVPQAYREGALALGAGNGRTFFTVTLPAALPGILTGAILSMSRAAGETAPLLFTAAIAVGPVPQSIMDPTRNLPYACYNIAVGDQIGALVPHQRFGMVTGLVLLVLLLNLVAILIRSRVSKKLRGQ